jgi:DNA repair ATPase RecN
MTPIQEEVKKEMIHDLEKQALEAEIHIAYLNQIVVNDIDARTAQVQADIEEEQRTIDSLADSKTRDDREARNASEDRADQLKTAKRKYEKQREEMVGQMGKLRIQATSLREKRDFVDGYTFE